MKEPLVHVTLRIPKDVADYFRAFPSFSSAIRAVLESHVKAKEDRQSPSL